MSKGWLCALKMSYTTLFLTQAGKLRNKSLIRICLHCCLWCIHVLLSSSGHPTLESQLPNSIALTSDDVKKSNQENKQ